VAKSSLLSADQQFALKISYTYLHYSIDLLEEYLAVIPDDRAEYRLGVENLLELGVLSLARLRSEFPEASEWEGGAS
jgi:hypothetical protein